MHLGNENPVIVHLLHVLFVDILLSKALDLSCCFANYYGCSTFTLMGCCNNTFVVQTTIETEKSGYVYRSRS